MKGLVIVWISLHRIASSDATKPLQYAIQLLKTAIKTKTASDLLKFKDLGVNNGNVKQFHFPNMIPLSTYRFLPRAQLT